ncbi:HNH endonuclease [Rhizobiaceae bacterium]|nr:HNH endonuclease [Rhizobiaceae bacterium]
MGIGWTTAETTALIRLWSKGVSAKQAADRIGGKTRNAVIGKAKRLGLSKTVIVTIKPPSRTGQAQFRRDVLNAYGSQCAMTGSKQIEVLEASHIVPHSLSPNNEMENALCLRSDIHCMFDCGLISVSERFTIILASTVTDHEYLGLRDAPLTLPTTTSDRPAAASFTWHRKNVLKNGGTESV